MNKFLFFQRAVAVHVINGSFNGVTVQELITLQAETAATMTVDHSDYSLLAGRIMMTNLYRETKSKFSGRVNKLTHRLIVICNANDVYIMKKSFIVYFHSDCM